MSDGTAKGPAAEAARLIGEATLGQRQATAEALDTPKRTPARVLDMMRHALTRAEDIIHQVLDLVPPPQPIACGANCPWCCHVRLTASPPEVLLVLDHIEKKFDDQQKAALKRKVANVDAFTRARDGDARAKMRLPCPLLKDGSCSVHHVRPLSCRAVVSVDVAACRRSYESRMQEPVPQHEMQLNAANGVGYGLHAGLVDAGFGVEDVEMNAALAIGLDEPDIAKRWLAGEPVFEPATLVIPEPQE